MTGPHDHRAAAGRDGLRAGHADREQVIETLKTAFAHGRLTRDELDARAGQALTARTCADLAALTAETPVGPAAAGSARRPAPARRRPLVRAAAGSGGGLIIAIAAVRVAFIFDPGGAGPNPFHSMAKPFIFLAVTAALTALGISVLGAAISAERRRRARTN